MVLGSGRYDYVAALFEGTIKVPTPKLNSWVLEAEDATELSSQVETDNIHSGFTGTAFVDYIGSGPEAYIQWELPLDSTEAGYYNLKLRYAMGKSESRPLELNSNGIGEVVDFPPTFRWSRWDYSEPVTVYLNSGANYIRASATGSSGPNIVSSYAQQQCISTFEFLRHFILTTIFPLLQLSHQLFLRITYLLKPYQQSTLLDSVSQAMMGPSYS